MIHCALKGKTHEETLTNLSKKL